MDKTAIIVTSYTGGDNPELKSKITRVLCRQLSQTVPNYLCLTTHSPIDVETQQYCNAFVYDSDNSFQINGLPKEELSHGLAELKAIHNAVNYLQNLGYTHFFKLTYDCHPGLDFNDLMMRAKTVAEQTGKSMVCSGWGIRETIGFLMFYAEIDFFKKAFPLDKAEMYHKCFEVQAYKVVESLGLVDQIYWHHNTYENYLGYHIQDFVHQGGTEFDHYPFE